MMVIEAKARGEFMRLSSTHQLLVQLLLCGRLGVVGALTDGPRWRFARWCADGGALVPEVSPVLEHPFEIALYFFAALVAARAIA